MRALLVEDDCLLGDGVAKGLRQREWTIDWLTDGLEAQQALQDSAFDVLILDLGLPRKSGLELLKTLRRNGSNVPVLILTARETVEDRVLGLDAGADDYLTKPFDLDELCARLRALQRRVSARSSPLVHYQEITLDPASMKVTFQEKPEILSRREFALLHKLIENKGKVLSREYLMLSLYGWSEDIESNALEVHVHNLRKKFGTGFIRTIRGVGYLVETDTDEPILP